MKEKCDKWTLYRAGDQTTNSLMEECELISLCFCLHLVKKVSIVKRQTSVDGEVLHRDGGGNLSDLVQVFFSQTGRGAAHGLRLSVQSEKT